MKRKIVDSMKTAWLAHWGFHSSNEDKKLKEYGISRRLVDIISTRKKLDVHIIPLAMDIFKQSRLYPSEKLYLEKYNKGRKRRNEFFGGNVPFTTSYRQKPNGQEYVSVGHNPYLEIRKVRNLVVYEDNGTEVVEWDWLTADGKIKHEQYKWSSL